jgi:hypothetical protein
VVCVWVGKLVCGCVCGGDVWCGVCVRGRVCVRVWGRGVRGEERRRRRRRRRRGGGGGGGRRGDMWCGKVK